jgi:hypothetical protein
MSSSSNQPAGEKSEEKLIIFFRGGFGILVTIDGQLITLTMKADEVYLSATFHGFDAK